MDTAKDITDYQFLKKLAALPFVNAIWLFGSRAIGDNTPRSDIDLAITCPNASVHQWQEVLDIIEEADTLLMIDCVRLDTLTDDNPLKKAILRHHLILFERNSHDS